MHLVKLFFASVNFSKMPENVHFGLWKPKKKTLISPGSLTAQVNVRSVEHIINPTLHMWSAPVLSDSCWLVAAAR